MVVTEVKRISRIAIVNRGEPAVRLIHAVRELNQEHGSCLRTIALYTEPDQKSLFVREADEGVALGPATFVDERDGQVKSSYLDYQLLRKALTTCRADAAWVGWGFVAEHADFADMCRRLKVVFIGPEGDVMRRLGDKIAFKRLAEEAGVPVTSWSGGAVGTEEEAAACAREIGFPLMIKAAAGGGGRGMRRVNAPNELPGALAGARAESLKFFGDDTVFLERIVVGARHVEVQVIADNHGAVWAVGVRDCSVQRRNQKVIEEAPSPALSPAQDQEIRDCAVRLARAAGYQNAGTVECLFDPSAQRFYFMEMNTRLQVEHPVTEATTGLDLVKLQLHVASGGRLAGEPPETVGHSIEARINAEDPDSDFAPSPGHVEVFRPATGPGIRTDTGFRQGNVIPSDFDSMVAKVIAWGGSRGEALARLRRALSETEIVVRGGMTNKAFLLEILGHPDVQRGGVDIGWLDRLTAARKGVQKPHLDVALIVAAIQVYEEQFEVEKTRFFASARRGRPEINRETGHTAELQHGGHTYKLQVNRLGKQHYRIKVQGRMFGAHIDRLDDHSGWITCRGARHKIVSIIQGLTHMVEVDSVPHRVSREKGGVVRAPAPGMVLSVHVKPGDLVAQGERLVVMEAMKMEMPILAPFTGRVREVMASINRQVDASSPLVLLQPERDQEEGADTEPVQFERYSSVALSSVDMPESVEEVFRERCRQNLGSLRRLMLGYDVDPATGRQLMREHAHLRPDISPDDEEMIRLEMDLLEIFVDVVSIFSRRTSIQDGRMVSTQEHLHEYLRTLDPGATMPSGFRAELERVLRWYGVSDLERTRDLEEALLWIHKSNSRLERCLGIVRGFLERSWEDFDSRLGRANEGYKQLLDRLIAATSERFQAVNELAWFVRYRLFDRPRFENARARTFNLMAEQLQGLGSGSTPEALEERVWTLVECPHPVMGFVSSRFESGDQVIRRLILEVLSRRLCWRHGVEEIEQVDHEGQSLTLVRYTNDAGRKIHAVATYARWPELGPALAAFKRVVEGIDDAQIVLLNLFVLVHTETIDEGAVLRECEATLAGVSLPWATRRIGISFVNPQMAATLNHFTFRTSDQGWFEDRIARGINPIVAERIELWRLRNFKTERLPSIEDIYIFKAVAKENPADERLFAFLDVRDFTTFRSGDEPNFAHLEQLFMAAQAAIRDVRHRRSDKRLVWNRIVLYIWPKVLFKLEQEAIFSRLAPLVEDVGLEKVVIRARMPGPDGPPVEQAIHFSVSAGNVVRQRTGPPSEHPIRPLTPYAQRVVRLRPRGLSYPFEIIRMLTPSAPSPGGFPRGGFEEHDLDSDGRLAAVDRPYGHNKANVVVGVIKTGTRKHPEGLTRVMILGDPSRGMGALAEPECRRVIQALDLAEELRVPVEWFPVSSGAKISMASGTENLDWTARVLRRIIEFTQAGGEINVVVDAVNVGAQSYWNAEATMLMHTSGVLIMTPGASMVLTGKKALDYSGGVSAEDHQGIGGINSVMGPNGQAQYAARDITEACRILLRHYDLTYVAPGERFPRSRESADPAERNIETSPVQCAATENGFDTVGEIFSREKNPDRKKPFDVRSVMRAVSDQDDEPLERWALMRDAEIAVVWDIHLGGIPVCLLGIESTPLSRSGFVPGDGPEYWSGGTLFPLASKKVARSINAASGRQPVVILANLSGFDGSPESMRKLQLEFGAEIGRAVVNFDGPMVFCVISRYHGGAYVVFSRALNENLEVAALEGSYASVIGGAPAAAVVFPGEVKKQTYADPRIAALSEEKAPNAKEELRRISRFNQVFKTVSAEKEREVAEQFDAVHTVHRAKEVGSLDHVIPPARLRPYLIEAVQRGMARCLGRAD